MNIDSENYRQMELEAIAAKRVHKIKRFFKHALIYAIGMTVFILKKYCNAPFNFPPLEYINWFFMSCWTVVLVVKGLKLFMKEIVLGKNWENRQLNKILNSESNHQNWQ